MNKVYLGALTILFVAFFIYGVHVENIYPHPSSGECQGCWVEHGMGTWEQIEAYNTAIGLPIIACFICCILLAVEGWKMSKSFFPHDKRGEIN